MAIKCFGLEGSSLSLPLLTVRIKSICPFCSACTIEMLWMNRKGFPNATNSLSADIECRLYVGHPDYFMYGIFVELSFQTSVK